MDDAPGIPPDADKEHAGNLPEAIPEQAIYAYNVDEGKTPGGMKVRWKIRVVTGAEATRYDTRQAEAIRELLQWAQRRTPTTT